MEDPNPEPLDNFVEFDKTYVGGKFANMNRGRRKKYQGSEIDNKTPIMGFIVRQSKTRLTLIIGENSFKDMVRMNVKKEATVITDYNTADIKV